MDNDTVNCHVYIRVSTKKQVRDGLSLENQRVKCHQFAESQGWRIHKTYHDEGVSGKSMNRPGFNKLLDNVRPGEIIVVNAFSRLGRNFKEMNEAYDALKKLNVRIVSVAEKQIDDSTPTGKFLLNIMFSMAEWELNETDARSKAVISNKKTCGEVVGHVGFGYASTEHNGRKYQYPVVSEQEGISFVINARSMDPPLSWSKIGKAMIKHNWRPKNGGDKWAVSSLQNLASNHIKSRKTDKITHMPLKDLMKYETHMVPLCVPLDDIDGNLMKDGRFDYTKKFGFMYGYKGNEFPTLSKLSEDVRNGLVDTKEEFKNDIINADTYGLDEDGTPMVASPTTNTTPSINLFEQDKDQLGKFLMLFGDIKDPSKMQEKANLFFS